MNRRDFVNKVVSGAIALKMLDAKGLEELLGKNVGVVPDYVVDDLMRALSTPVGGYNPNRVNEDRELKPPFK